MVLATQNGRRLLGFIYKAVYRRPGRHLVCADVVACTVDSAFDKFRPHLAQNPTWSALKKEVARFVGDCLSCEDGPYNRRRVGSASEFRIDEIEAPESEAEDRLIPHEEIEEALREETRNQKAVAREERIWSESILLPPNEGDRFGAVPTAQGKERSACVRIREIRRKDHAGHLQDFEDQDCHAMRVEKPSYVEVM